MVSLCSRFSHEITDKESIHIFFYHYLSLPDNTKMAGCLTKIFIRNFAAVQPKKKFEDVNSYCRVFFLGGRGLARNVNFMIISNETE